MQLFSGFEASHGMDFHFGGSTLTAPGDCWKKFIREQADVLEKIAPGHNFPVGINVCSNLYDLALFLRGVAFGLDLRLHQLVCNNGQFYYSWFGRNDSRNHISWKSFSGAKAGGFSSISNTPGMDFSFWAMNQNWVPGRAIQGQPVRCAHCQQWGHTRASHNQFMNQSGQQGDHTAGPTNPCQSCMGLPMGLQTPAGVTRPGYRPVGLAGNVLGRPFNFQPSFQVPTPLPGVGPINRFNPMVQAAPLPTLRQIPVNPASATPAIAPPAYTEEPLIDFEQGVPAIMGRTGVQRTFRLHVSRSTATTASTTAGTAATGTRLRIGETWNDWGTAFKATVDAWVARFSRVSVVSLTCEVFTTGRRDQANGGLHICTSRQSWATGGMPQNLDNMLERPDYRMIAAGEDRVSFEVPFSSVGGTPIYSRAIRDADARLPRMALLVYKTGSSEMSLVVSITLLGRGEASDGQDIPV